MAIGATTSTRALLVNATSNTKVVLQEGGADKGFIGAGGSGFYIGNLAGKILFRNSADASTLLIENDGTQDHQGNATVNSASIQGLQDSGACYDFDGSTGYISLGSDVKVAVSVPHTMFAWIKTASTVNNANYYGANPLHQTEHLPLCRLSESTTPK